MAEQAAFPKADSKTPKAIKRKNTSPPELQTPLKMTAEQASSQRVNGIIMFNISDKHLYSYKLTTKEWSRMQVFPECNSHLFTTVVSGKHIYLIRNQKVYQLEYSDSAAKWKEMSSMIEDHGWNPPAVMLNGFIYVCGSGSADVSRSVERYDAAQDRWDRMCDMNTARRYNCVVATEDHIYCIGGQDEQYELHSVERFNERLNKWEFVESAPRPIVCKSAAVVKNRIYVSHIFCDDNEGIQCFDIQNNSWSEIDLTIQWPFVTGWSVKILAVDEELYIIGPIHDSKRRYKSAIYLLEPETKQMTLIEEFKDKNINPRACLAVKL